MQQIPTLILSTQEKHLAFAVGLKSVLSTWPIIVLAVENNFGGVKTKEKVHNLFNELVVYFKTNKEIRQHELEDFLDEFFQTQLNMIAEDNSIPFVVRLLVQLRESLESGTLEFLNQLLKKNYQISPIDKVFGGNKLSAFVPHSEEETISNLIHQTNKLTITTQHPTQRSSLLTNNTNINSQYQNPIDVDDDDDDESESGWTTVKKKRR